MIKSHRDLLVWQRSLQLTDAVYEVARMLPSHESYGLTSQIRRAAVSITANIAEGKGRTHKGDYIRHLSIARGSVAELDALFAIIRKTYPVDQALLEGTQDLMSQTGKMLSVLINRLKAPST